MSLTARGIELEAMEGWEAAKREGINQDAAHVTCL